MSGSGLRRHDPRHCRIAPRACRETLLPASHHCCPGDPEGAGNAGDHAKLTPSTAAATTKSTPRSSVRRRQPRPAHPLRKTPPRQISIDRRPATQPPRVPSWEAFGSRPSVRLDRFRPAGIRNPAPYETVGLPSENRRSAPISAVHNTGDRALGAVGACCVRCSPVKSWINSSCAAKLSTLTFVRCHRRSL